jgi:hypothetical protein
MRQANRLRSRWDSRVSKAGRLHSLCLLAREKYTFLGPPCIGSLQDSLRLGRQINNLKPAQLLSNRRTGRAIPQLPRLEAAASWSLTRPREAPLMTGP